jgi:hypothetical protein
MRGAPALAFTLTLVGVGLVACVPDQLEQPQSGDGWRLIGWTRGGEQRPPAAGDAALELLADLGLRRMDAPVEPTDAHSEIDVVVTHGVSGSCPQVRLDGLRVDAEAGTVVAQITDRDELFSPFGTGCTADANPVVYWLAVRRDFLPPSFSLSTDEAPDVAIQVELGQ